MSIEDIMNEWRSSKACKKLEEVNQARKAKRAAAPSKKKRKRAVLVYSEYIVSAAWKKKRLRVISQRHGRCEFCLSKETLQVHHLNYDRLGHERPNDLQVLCRSCHASMHEEKGAQGELTGEFLDVVRNMV